MTGMQCNQVINDWQGLMTVPRAKPEWGELPQAGAIGFRVHAIGSAVGKNVKLFFESFFV
jgi:hypothetical protein